jgi:import receptor subunit TOM70
MQEMHQNVIEDCARAIELDPGYVKAVMRRAQAYEATDKLEDALDGVGE